MTDKDLSRELEKQLTKLSTLSENPNLTTEEYLSVVKTIMALVLQIANLSI